MYDVMQGIRVIEVAEHTFVPAASMVLADWGADVIKIERTTDGGDPGRNLGIPNSERNGISMFFEAGNRGKRSLALDLTSADGVEILHKLIVTADVFLTNLRAGARKKLGIEADDVLKLNPRIIYARGTGYGLRGAMANDPGFDFPSSWCRSGAGYMQTLSNGEPPMQPGSVGDLGGGATLAGAISAALFRRERTGKGAIVDNALYLVGIYLMSQSLIAASIGLDRRAAPRSETSNALNTLYRTRDNRWIALCLLVERWWPDLMQHIDRAALIGDQRFSTPLARHENCRQLIGELELAFAEQDLAFWIKRLATLQGVWASLQSPREVVEDRQAIDNGFVTPIRTGDGRTYMTGASPAQFDEAPIGMLHSAPGYGEHSENVLRDLGLEQPTIDKLRKEGVIR
jgi:crotonobetainyl-CoA:carnitine CoA-transferase CaiB-like acyl-CoA transferase